MLIFPRHCPQLTSLGICIDVRDHSQKLNSVFSFPCSRRSISVVVTFLQLRKWYYRIHLRKPPIIRGCQKYWDSVGRSMIAYSKANLQGSAPRSFVFSKIQHVTWFGSRWALVWGAVRTIVICYQVRWLKTSDRSNEGTTRIPVLVIIRYWEIPWCHYFCVEKVGGWRTSALQLR